MKKVILTAITGIIIAGNAAAQYLPEAGTWSTEIQFTPWTSGSSFQLNQYGVKGRYFVSDKFAVRASLGFNMRTEKGFEYGDDWDGKEVEQKTVNRSTGLTFLPGIEWHTSPWERISIYYGAEAGIQMQFASQKITNAGFETGDTYEVKGWTEFSNGTVSNKGFGFVVNAFTGIDFYIAKGLYMGAEFGLGFRSFKTGKIEETTKSGSSKNTTTYDNHTQTSNLGFYCMPAFRIGWKF